MPVHTNLTESRKAVLWNIVQPNDPYDIRKSRIAKLPQHPSVFMGDNLELVCLLQAAQIERLSLHLEQFTVKLREYSTVELDRHSYQIQIKELAQKVSQMNSMTTEIERLKQFIKRQSEQLESLKVHRNSSQNLMDLQGKYESVLSELKLCRDNLSTMQKSNSNLVKQVSQWRYKYEKTEQMLIEQKRSIEQTLQIRIQEFKSQWLQQHQTRGFQLQGQVAILKENLAKVKSDLTQAQDQYAKKDRQLFNAEAEINRLEKQLYENNHREDSLLNVSKKLEDALLQLEKTEKINLSLKGEVDYLKNKVNSLQKQLTQKQRYISNQSNLSSTFQQKLSQCESKISQLDSQLQKEQHISRDLRTEIQQKQRNILNLNRQLSDSRQSEQRISFQLRRVEEQLSHTKINSEVQEQKNEKISLMAVEINRLNDVIQQKLNEISEINLSNQHAQHGLRQQINTKGSEIHSLTLKTRDQQAMIQHVNQKVANLQTHINQQTSVISTLQREKYSLGVEIGELKVKQNSSTAQQSQIHKLNQLIRHKQVENQKLLQDNEKMFRQIHELNMRNNQLENAQQSSQYQFMSEKSNYEAQNKRLHGMMDTRQKDHEVKIAKLEQSLHQYSQEMNRLHELLVSKEKQVERYKYDWEAERNKVAMLEKRNSSEYEMASFQYEKKISFLEAKCQSLEKHIKELEEERKQFILKLEDFNQKLTRNTNEFDRFEAQITMYKSQVQQADKRCRTLQNQLHECREFKNQNENHLKNEVTTLRQKSQEYLSETQRLKHKLEDLMGEFRAIQAANSQLENQRDSKLSELNTTTRQLQEANSQIHRLQSQLSRLSASSSQYQQKYFELQSSFLRLQNQNQNNISMIQNERTRYAELMKKHNEVLREFEQIENHYRHLSSSHEQESDQLAAYEEKVALLSQEIERLEQKNRQLLEENRTSKGDSEEMRRKLDVKARQNEQYRITITNVRNQVNELHGQINFLKREGSGSEGLISQLRGQISQLQAQMVSLKNENSNLAGQNDSLKSEIHTLNHQQSENKSDQQIQSLQKQLHESQTETINLRNMLEEYESINAHSMAENAELFKISHELKEQVERLKLEVGQQSGSLQQRLTETQNRYRDLEFQYNSLVEQNSTLQRQLSHMNQNSQQQISSYNHKLQQYEREINQIKAANSSALGLERQKINEQFQDLQKQAHALSILEQDNQSLTVTINSLRNQMQSLRRLEEQLNLLKGEHINVKLENQELNRITHEMQEEILQLRSYGEKSQVYLQKVQSLEVQKSHMSQQIHNMHKQINSLQAEVNSLRKDSTEHHQRYNQQLKQIQLEKESIYKENQSLRVTINQFSIQIEELSVALQNSTEWEQKYTTLYEAYQKIYQVHGEVTRNFELSQTQIENYRTKFEQSNIEFEKLRRAIEILTEENKKLHLQLQNHSTLIYDNEQLAAEIDRLKRELQTLRAEDRQIKRRLTDQTNLEKRIDQYMVLMVMLFAEIESLRNRVISSEKQCEDVRRMSLSPHRHSRKAMSASRRQ